MIPASSLLAKIHYVAESQVYKTPRNHKIRADSLPEDRVTMAIFCSLEFVFDTTTFALVLRSKNLSTAV